MKFLLFINCMATGWFFGMWQDSLYAGGFMFLCLGAVLSMIDYAKQQSLQDSRNG